MEITKKTNNIRTLKVSAEQFQNSQIESFRARNREIWREKKSYNIKSVKYDKTIEFGPISMKYCNHFKIIFNQYF